MWLVWVVALLGAELKLDLKAAATVQRDAVYLHDLLTPATRQRLRAQSVADFVIADGPGWNRNKVIGKNQIAAALADRYPNLNPQFGGSKHVLVKRASVKVSQTAIEDAVREWLAEQSPATGALHIDRMMVPPLRKAPSGEVRFEVRATGAFKPVGRSGLFVDVFINDAKFRTLAVQVYISLETLVPVAMRDIERGQPLNEDNVSWEMRRLTRFSGGLISPDQFDDLQTRTVVRAGSVVTNRQVQIQPLVERNQPVLITATSGPLEIRMRALAMEKGGRGERIRVKNVETGKIFLAQVKGDGEAVVQLAP